MRVARPIPRASRQRARRRAGTSWPLDLLLPIFVDRFEARIAYGFLTETLLESAGQTARFGLSEPQTSTDRRLFRNADTIKVRVIASDGFRSVTTEKTLRVADI